MRVQNWGDEVPKSWGVGTGCSHPHRKRGLERRQIFCFVISKWHIFVNSEVLKLKIFLIVSSLSWVWVDSVTNFGFSSKTMNKRHH